MNSRQLLLRLLLKAVWVRKDRSLTALISVAVVATIATAALTIYSDLEGKLSHEFRGFGANVIVTKQQSSPLTPDDLSRIDAIAGVKRLVVPVAYAVAASRGGAKVVIGGADLEKLVQMNSSWSITGWSATGKATQAIVGSRAAEILPEGSSINISVGGRTKQFAASPVFHSGSDEDSRIYMNMADFTQLSGIQPSTALVRVEGRPLEIQNAITQLSAALPDAEAKPVRQITQAQTSVVGKTRSLVLASSAVVVVLIMLCMVATFTSSVLERRKDFAVMKALGASNRTVNSLFAAEAALLALSGSIVGYILVCGIAFGIGKVNFEAAILPQPVLLLPVLLGSVVLALLASTAPLRLLQQIQPAGILRGE